ncbi:hypothetical protein [Nonomuraea sp. NPDC049784]|uniref:hypothetical protein n=1 Tax=Nonomuraea sp. NPDC049784 TaxID=3154361 RepID=UPI0033FD6F63
MRPENDQCHGKPHFERVLSHVRYADRLRKETGAALRIAVSFVEVAETEGQLPGLQQRQRHLDDDLHGTLCEKCIPNRPGPMYPLDPDLAVTELPVLTSAPLDEWPGQ